MVSLQHIAIKEPRQVTVVRQPVPELLDTQVLHVAPTERFQFHQQVIRRQAVNQPFVILELADGALKEFVTAGEPLLFKRNLLVAVRLLRDDQPTIGLLQALVDRFAFTLYRFRATCRPCWSSRLILCSNLSFSIDFQARYLRMLSSHSLLRVSSGAMKTSILR